MPCATIEQLIYIAYASYGAPEAEHLVNDDAGWISDASKVRGGPAWVHSAHDQYAIEATAAGVKERTVLMGTMLRSLLEDRFHLTFHRETEQVGLYAMSVGKAGFKLKPMKPGDCDPDAKASATPNGSRPKCGSESVSNSHGKVRWTFAGFNLSRLAGQLSRAFGVHVMDTTGIKDNFVFSFEFVEDQDQLITESSIYAALSEQLGLKLEKTKGPRGFIVIDGIERPTPDDAFVPPQSSARAVGRFEIVSVKPCEPAAPIPGARSGGSGTFGVSPGKLNATCMTIAEMITRAYIQYGNPPPLNVQGLFNDDTIKGGPAWARVDRYTIEAKADGTPAPTEMMGAMLRVLLEDRFQLKIHQDVKEVQAYALTVAAGGLKLKPVDPASCTPADPNSPGGPRTIGADGLVRAVGGDKPLCTGGVGRHGTNLTYTTTGQSLDRVARTIGALVLGHPVIDKTETKDLFSFKIEFAPDENMRPMPGPPGDPSDAPAGASLFTVLEKQLGLKLIPAKAQQGYLVIDRVERPTPNAPVSIDASRSARRR